MSPVTWPLCVGVIISPGVDTVVCSVTKIVSTCRIRSLNVSNERALRHHRLIMDG